MIRKITLFTMRRGFANPGEGNTRQPWLAVIIIGLATFSVVTTEMLPVGLLTSIADSYGVTSGRLGLTLTLPAFLAALLAPFIVMAAGGFDRRHILTGLLGLLVVGNLASSFAGSFIALLSARALIGFCMGGIWAIAGGLAGRLVPANKVGLGTSIIFGGVAAASVLGIPLGALIGDLFGWRWAFGCMAFFSGLVFILHLIIVPNLPVDHSTHTSAFLEQLIRRKIQCGLGLTLLLVTGHFMAFTYVRPLLLSVSGLELKWIGTLLFVYGAAGIVGNFMVGGLAARYTQLALVIISAGLLVALLVFIFMGQTPIGSVVGLLLWGLSYGGVSVGLMTWMIKAAPEGVEIASALYVAVFNIAIGLGAWLGGWVIDGFGLISDLYVAGSLCALALIVALILSHPQTAQ